MGDPRTPDVTAEVLEVMSEPVRWRAYVWLRNFGPRKAAGLARRLGLGETSMLRHLVAMQSVGFVAADDEAVPERQRTWNHVPGGLRLTELVGVETVDAMAMRRWMQAFLLSQHQFLRDWVQEEATWPVEWSQASMNHDYWFRLEPQELEELTQELRGVLESDKWARRSVERRPRRDDSQVLVYVPANAIPVRDS